MPENGNGNGKRNGLLGALAQIPLAAWGLIISQFAALAIWAVRLDQRVRGMEAKIDELSEHDTIPGRLLKQQVEILEQRQRYLVNYALFLREQMVRNNPPSGQVQPPPLPSTSPLDPPGPTPEQKENK